MKKRTLFYSTHLGPAVPVKPISLHPRYHDAIAYFRKRQKHEGFVVRAQIDVRVKVTARRPGYQRGEVLTIDLCDLVHRKQRKLHALIETIAIDELLTMIDSSQIFYEEKTAA